MKINYSTRLDTNLIKKLKIRAIKENQPVCNLIEKAVQKLLNGK